jgi:hypothetical protein
MFRTTELDHAEFRAVIRRRDADFGGYESVITERGDTVWPRLNVRRLSNSLEALSSASRPVTTPTCARCAESRAG